MSDKPVTPTTENPEALTLAFWECGHVEVDRGVEHPCDRDVCSATYASYAPVAAGRAAASPDPPDAYTACVEALAEWWTGEATAAEVTGWMNGALQAARLPELDREAAISMCNMVMADLGDECDYGAVVSNVLRVAFPAASPDERLREAGVWPDQSAMHGVLLDQIKDAYAEGIADTLDRIRVRAAEMLPEVARFTLDEIEALAAADREAPDEKVRAMTLPDGESYCPPAADREKPERICCRGMGADGGCNICAAEATR